MILRVGGREQHKVALCCSNLHAEQLRRRTSDQSSDLLCVVESWEKTSSWMKLQFCEPDSKIGDAHGQTPAKQLLHQPEIKPKFALEIN